MAGNESHHDVERTLCEAIKSRLLISLTLESHERIVEPHDYGVIYGHRRLFCFQVGGTSRSAHPIGWRWADLTKISGLRLLDRHFAGARPAPTGRHHTWEQIIASVSRPPTQ